MRVRQAAPRELDVQLRSATPNFECYLLRIGGGAWRTLAGDRERWTLREGENRLEVRTRNLFGIEGPVVAAVVRLEAR